VLLGGTKWVRASKVLTASQKAIGLVLFRMPRCSLLFSIIVIAVLVIIIALNIRELFFV